MPGVETEGGPSGDQVVQGKHGVVAVLRYHHTHLLMDSVTCQQVGQAGTGSNSKHKREAERALSTEENHITETIRQGGGEPGTTLDILG